MKVSRRPKIGIKLPALGLMLQLFAIILLPLTLILVAITFGSLSIHQQAMRSLVGERDARAVRNAASALNAQVDNRIKEVQTVAEMILANPTEPLTTTLDNLSLLMTNFDAGVAFFNPQGEQVSTQGDPQAVSSWIAGNPNWPGLINSLTTQPKKLQVIQPHGNASPLGLISVRLDNNNLLVGAFSIGKLVENTLGEIFPPGG
jgi:hypothetical protein